MPISRRTFNIMMTGLLTAPFAPRGVFAAEEAPRTPPDRSPAQALCPMTQWPGKEQIAFVIYPDFTALDMVGPHYMLTNLVGATTHLVAKTQEPVKSDAGLVFVPSATFDECPLDLDLICVPGGTAGTLAAMQDEATLRFLKDRGQRAKYVTSVCTGSLLLGAAGLLEGYKATSHWVAKDVLRVFGAIPTEGRIVRDRNRITGGGVTAGIDFGLSLVGSLRDAPYAEAVQLLAEYAPEPPYNAGTPGRAPIAAKTMVEGMLSDFVKQAEIVGRTAFAKAQPPQ
ncbi:MAG: DJ-1/PfpI family protein [Candidatus Binatia bacterium]